MNQPKNRTFFFIFCLLAFVLFFVFRSATSNRFQTVAKPETTPTPIHKSATTIIEFSDKKITSFTQDVAATESAFSLLLAVSARQKVPVTYKTYSFGTLVDSIGEVKNTKDKAWIYFINGNSASVGADSYKVNSGDTVEWKYLTPTF